MRKASVITLIAILVAGAAPFPSAGQTGVAPGLTVISDAPNPSPAFVQFFYFFNQKLIQWWQNEGRVAAQGKWVISVSEFYNEDGEPRGITMMVKSPVPSLRILIRITVNRQPTTGAEPLASAAADIVIALIETPTEDRK